MSRYDPDKKPQSIAELEPLILAAQAELSALCNGKKFRMSIPVQDDDSDMVIGDALRHSLAFVRAAIELLASQSVADSPTWQPIETAPKDGTRILAVGFIDGKPFGDEVYWSEDDYNDLGPSWRTWKWFRAQPSIWMPLPSAPSASAAEETNKTTKP